MFIRGIIFLVTKSRDSSEISFSNHQRIQLIATRTGTLRCLKNVGWELEPVGGDNPAVDGMGSKRMGTACLMARYAHGRGNLGHGDTVGKVWSTGSKGSA